MGRDHTGVDNYYSNNDTHKLLDKVGNIGIELVLFDTIKYSSIQKRYVNTRDIDNNKKKGKYFSISGSEARQMFNEGKQPPEWFMRKEVSNMILHNMKSDDKVFVV